MRQHVLAFAVALAVWILLNGAGLILSSIQVQAQTSVVQARCFRYAVPLGFSENHCTPQLDGTCSGYCSGEIVLAGECVYSGEPNRICHQTWNENSPVYSIFAPCVFYQDVCYCTNLWQLGAPTGRTVAAPDCRDAVGGGGGEQ